MLKKAERLTHALFTTCFKQGKKINNEYTVVVYCPYDRFLSAVVVGKKVSKKAVVRNSVRRRVYAVVEKFKKDKELKGIFIFLVKPKVIGLTKKQFQTVIDQEVGRSFNKR